MVSSQAASDAQQPAQRLALIRARLEERFSPLSLELTDESHRHAGHAGARTGKGHFHVRIIARAFEGVPPVQRHRMIYEALDELMQNDIHALSIEASSPA